MKNLNFVFFGTPEVASKTLEILKENSYLPSLIITSPDKPQGRKMIITPPPVKIWAIQNHIPYLQPEKLNDEFISTIESLNFDLSIVVAYGKIIPENLIKIPKLGTINIHYSLLPKYRGASPLESALLNGDNTTGITIQQMAFKLDSGPILAQKEISIDKDQTKNGLRDELIKVGGDLLCQTIPNIINQTIIKKPQDESKATHCTKIKKEDGEININDNGEKNYNKYRAFYGWPGTYFFTEKYDKKIRVKITQASYENNSFQIERVIPEGKKETNYSDFLKQN